MKTFARSALAPVGFVVFGMVVLLSAGLGSCSSGDITDPNQISFPDSNVSFRAQVYPYLSLSCAFAGCHDDARSENYNIALTSYFGVTNTAVVNLQRDTNCGLLNVVFGRDIGHIPVKSNDNSRNGLRTWVLEGARNN